MLILSGYECMNKKQGLVILGLPENATRAQAKASFRRLAKAYHPDRWVNNPLKARAAEESMKQINAAFRLVLPLLPEEDVSVSESASSKPVQGPFVSRRCEDKESPGFFSLLSAGWKKRFTRKNRQQPFSSGQNRPGKTGAGFSVRPAGRPGFDTFLKNVCAEKPLFHSSGHVPKAGQRTQSSFQNLWGQRKIKTGFSKRTGPGPVERISPIQPVSRVKKIT